MDIIEAIRSRKSVRGFKPDPVSRELIREILYVATRAPSGKNYQPWEFTVVSGKPLESIGRGNIARMLAGELDRPDIIFEPDADSRHPGNIEVTAQLYKLLGIERDDRDKRAEWRQRSYRFFDPPAVIFISTDRSISVTQTQYDIGLVSQNICLAALQYGLGTCIVRQGVVYPDIIRELTGIPALKYIAIAIAIGYPDWDYPANHLDTTRKPVDNITVWHGFD